MASPEPWLTERPAELIDGPSITLRRWSPEDTDELVEAVNDTLDELRPWMPWAQHPATPEGIAAVIEEADTDWVERRTFSYTIRLDDDRATVAGCCGLHDRIGPGAMEIGYWVRTRDTGRGVATEAARRLTQAAFALPGVNRVEIHCDEANTRSAAVPRKLGFRLERIEHRPPDTPGETDRRLIWIAAPGDVEAVTQ